MTVTGECSEIRCHPAERVNTPIRSLHTFFFGRPRLRFLILLSSLFLLFACDNPIVRFGQKLDTSAWIDINAPGSIPLMRSWDNGHSVEFLILEGQVLPVPSVPLTGNSFGSFNIIRFEDDVTSLQILTTIVQGTYTIDSGANYIQLDLKTQYSLVSRNTGGSIPTSSSQSETELNGSNNFPIDRNIIGTTVDINGYTYTRMDTVIDNIMGHPDSQRAAEIASLYQIGFVFGLQSRVTGFGGPDMLNYTTPTIFGSLMSNETSDYYNTVSLKQTFRALATFTYTDASDMKPLIANGEYSTDTDFFGSGTVSGIVDFTMKGTATTWNCRFDNNNISVEYTIPDGGTYQLSVDGQFQNQSVPFDNSNPGNLNYLSMFP